MRRYTITVHQEAAPTDKNWLWEIWLQDGAKLMDGGGYYTHEAALCDAALALARHHGFTRLSKEQPI